MYKQAKFYIDDMEIVEGYTKGGSWNGWACPYFTREQADKVVEHYTNEWSPARYDLATDSYVFITDGTGDKNLYDPVTDAELDGNSESRITFEGMDIVINGEWVRVYPIGAGCWIWDVYEEDGMGEND